MGIKKFIDGMKWVCTGQIPEETSKVSKAPVFQKIDISLMQNKIATHLEKTSHKQKILFVAYCIQQLLSHIKYPDRRTVAAYDAVKAYVMGQTSGYDIEKLVDDAKAACEGEEIEINVFKEIDFINQSQRRMLIKKDSSCSNMIIRLYMDIATAGYMAIQCMYNNSAEAALSTAKLTADAYYIYNALDIVLTGEDKDPELIKSIILKEIYSHLESIL